MRHPLAVTARILLAAACAIAARGQEPPNRYSGDGYVFFSADRPRGASFTELLTVGGGGEGLLYRGLGVNADIGYQFVRGYPGEGVGLASLNGCYHFVDRSDPARLAPFVTAGYGIAFRTGHLNLFNYGGGVNYWFHRHLGLRVEIRDFRAQYGHYATALRIGLAFR